MMCRSVDAAEKRHFGKVFKLSRNVKRVSSAFMSIFRTFSTHWYAINALWSALKRPPPPRPWLSSEREQVKQKGGGPRVRGSAPGGPPQALCALPAERPHSLGEWGWIACEPAPEPPGGEGGGAGAKPLHSAERSG